MTRLVLRPLQKVEVDNPKKELLAESGEIILIPEDMNGPLQPLEVRGGKKKAEFLVVFMENEFLHLLNRETLVGW